MKAIIGWCLGILALFPGVLFFSRSKMTEDTNKHLAKVEGVIGEAKEILIPTTYAP
jgi:hypothetical protein